MGRVRTATVKKAAKQIVEKYYPILQEDFENNKRICGEIAIIPSKSLRNKIAGYVSHLMKRIQKGTVKGISLKLQEEEKEKKMDFIPEVSFIEQKTKEKFEIDEDVASMLGSIGFGELENVTIKINQPVQKKKKQQQQSQQ